MKYLLLLFFASTPSFALVDMQNANFTETFTFLDLPDTGFNLKFEGSYNSRTLHNGLLGFGWCTNYETRLDILADGRVKRIECGAGQETVYTPRSFDSKNIQTGINKILEALKKENPRLSQRELASLRAKLQTDAFFRDQETIRLKIQEEVKEGTVFFSEGNTTDRIVFRKNIYIRESADTSSERFDKDGKLVFLYDKNQNFIKIDYNKNSLVGITSSSGKKLSFAYTQNGKIREIRGPAGINLEFKYEKLNDLAYAKSGKKEEYIFKYDALHNLTHITYPDKTTKKLKYNQDKDWVTELVDKNNCIEKYNYELSKQDPRNHYWSSVTKTCDNKVVNKSRYGFWFKPRKNGSGVFLTKLSIDANGVKSEIEYHDIFEKPVTIKNAKENIRYDYYSNGLLKTKRVNNHVVQFKYNNQNKVSEVVDGKLVTKFEYDKSGNLTYAANSNGQTVRLTWDNKGRIVKMYDQAKRLLNFEYDERFGKPKTVERPGVGKIHLSYNAQGEIAKVDSKDMVATQIVSAFNNLTDIISPAGVNISL